jgi:ketosteroid isomerase-like protein
MYSFRRIVFTGLIVAAVLVALPAVSSAGGHEGEVAKEIMKITYAAWKADMAKDHDAQMALLADDYTEFNGDMPTRVDGKAMTGRFYEALNQGAGEVVAAEMANPKVQVYGDVAILTYNYLGMSKNTEGEVDTNLAKSTRVYVKMGESWKLVHANFAPVITGD